MSFGPQFNDLMEKKYSILQQNADAETTRANAVAQNVGQQQTLQQQADIAAQARAQLNADTQLQSTSMNNQGANYRTGLTSGLENNYRMAGLGLDAAKYASDDETKRLALTRADEYSNGLKINPTDSYIGSVARGLRMSGLQFPSSPIPQLPGYKDGGRPPVDRPVVVGKAGPETFVPDNGARPVAVGQSGPEVVTTPVRGTVLPNAQTTDADLQRRALAAVESQPQADFKDPDGSLYRRALAAVTNQPKPKSDPLPPLTRNGGIEIWYSNPKQDQSPTLGQQRTRDLGSQFINNLHVMNDAERKDAWENARPEDRFAAIQEYNRLKNAGENPVNPRQQASVPSWESNLNLAPSHTPSYRERLQSPQAPVEDGDTQAIEQDKGVPLEQHPGVISRVLSDYEDRGARAPLALTAGIPMAGGVLGGALGSALGGPLGMVVGGDLGATAGTVVAPYIPSPPEDSHGMQVMRDVRNRLNGLGDTLGVNRNWGQGLESLIYGETPEQRQARRRNGLGQ